MQRAILILISLHLVTLLINLLPNTGLTVSTFYISLISLVLNLSPTDVYSLLLESVFSLNATLGVTL